MNDSAVLTQDERRNRLATRLLKWLDEALDVESPPDGIASEIVAALENDEAWEKTDEDTDWYGLQAALTALTQEIRLQSRAFARLSGHLEEREASSAPTSDETALQLAQIQEKLDEVAKGRRPLETELLSGKGIVLLLDIRDRLIAAEQAARDALEAAEAALPTWWPARALIKKSSMQLINGYQSLLKGYGITLERLDDTLADIEISETVRIGDIFDPATMKVVDIEESDSDPEGTVLAIYRRGYRQGDRLLRPAEVKVARAVSGLANKGETA